MKGNPKYLCPVCKQPKYHSGGNKKCKRHRACNLKFQRHKRKIQKVKNLKYSKPILTAETMKAWLLDVEQNN